MDTNNTNNVLLRGIWIARDAVYKVVRLPRLAYVDVRNIKIIFCLATWKGKKYIRRYYNVRAGSPSHLRLRALVKSLGYVSNGGYVSFSVPGRAETASGKVKRFHILPHAEVVQ